MQGFEVPQSTNHPWARRIWWIAVAGATGLSLFRLITTAFTTPVGSQLRYFLFGVLGILTALAFIVAVVFVVWLAGFARIRNIRAKDSHAPVAYLVGLAEDSNDVLRELGASHSFKKPSHASLSFGATSEGLHVYRRFSHHIASISADRIDDIRLERRTLASGPVREVMSFTIRDETNTPHRLSFTMFSPAKLCMIPHSKKYMEGLLAEFCETLGLKDRVV